MTTTPASTFVYVTYIRTTPDALWTALTSNDFVPKYWFGVQHETTWKSGAPWQIAFADGRVADRGEILEIDPPKRLVLKWRNVLMPELAAEGDSRCTMELEPVNDTVKLTITHAIDVPDSKFIKAVSGGWPKILSNLKSLLETGDVLLKG